MHDLNELRRIAVDALNNEGIPLVPRHERDMVVPAEVVIRLIDDFNSAGAPPADELAARITEYLSAGGFFNPELMEHDKVRDLLIACRSRLALQSREQQ